MDEKRIEIAEQILHEIDDTYVAELTEIMAAEPQRKRQKNIIWAFLGAAAVLVLVAAGTANILHHQNGEEFPVQMSAGERETTTQSIAVSNNDERESTMEYQERDWQSEPMYAFYNGKLYAYEGSWRKEVPSDAVFVGDGIIVQGQPERELEVSGVPEGVKVYYSEEKGYVYDYVYLSTGYECFLLRELNEHCVVHSYRYSYDLLPEAIKERYPLPNGEQMAQWGQQIQDYSWLSEAGWREQELCWILNYFDVMDMGQTELFVLLDMDIQQAEELTKVRLTEILVGDGVSRSEETEGAYGYVCAGTLLKLLNNGYGAQIFLLRLQESEKLLAGDYYNIESTEFLNSGLVYHVLFYQYNGMSDFYMDENGKIYIIIIDEYCC